MIHKWFRPIARLLESTFVRVSYAASERDVQMCLVPGFSYGFNPFPTLILFKRIRISDASAMSL